MRELVFSVKKEDRHFMDYIYKRLQDPICAVGGICVINNGDDKVEMGIGVYDECFPAINKLAKGAVAEVLAVGYKNRYLKEHTKINSSTLLGKVLLDTMCIFDSNYDTALIKKSIYDLNDLSLEGCYNFRIKEVKKKWDDIVLLSNSYSNFLVEKGVAYEFLAYLLDAIPCLTDTISIIVNDNLLDFQLLNMHDVVLSKFEVFLKNKNLEEELIFNMICYNPNLIRFCCSQKIFTEDFIEIVNEFFNVREFLPKNN